MNHAHPHAHLDSEDPPDIMNKLRETKRNPVVGLQQLGREGLQSSVVGLKLARVTAWLCGCDVFGRPTVALDSRAMVVVTGPLFFGRSRTRFNS